MPRSICRPAQRPTFEIWIPATRAARLLGCCAVGGAIRLESFDAQSRVGAAENQANEEQLKWANAAVMALGDTLLRAAVNSGGHGLGLRGGRFETQGSAAGMRVALHQVRWTEDVAINQMGELPI